MKKIIVLISILLVSYFLLETVYAVDWTENCPAASGSCFCYPSGYCEEAADCFLSDTCAATSCPSRPNATSSSTCAASAAGCACSPENECYGTCSCTVPGLCSYTCDAGYEDNDGEPSNGCEALANEASCNLGNDCASDLCVEGTCRAVCIEEYNGDQCSYQSDNLWSNHGICAKLDNEGSWFPVVVAAFVSPTYYGTCTALACPGCDYGTECDSNTAGGYSADCVCGGANHGTMCNNFARNNTASNQPDTCGAESTVCDGYNSSYCDDVSDSSWDTGDTAGTDKYRCDDTDDACIKCDANNKEMTGLSGNETNLEGDGKCEFACGAAATCDEKDPGDDCGTCLKCSSSCQCTDYYTTYDKDSTDPGTCDGADQFCSSGVGCDNSASGDGNCEPDENYSSTADCCKSDLTACSSYGSNTTCTSDGLCHETKCGASSECDGDAIGACGDSEGDCDACTYSDCGAESWQCCDSDCGREYTDYGCSGGSCWGPTTGSCTDCGYYSCSGGSCTSTCSQTCGAPCDDDGDCGGKCLSTCTCVNCIVSGIALDFYTGERINGNITAVPVENPGNKTIASITSGEWSMSFNMLTDDVEYLSFIINTTDKAGYTYMKLDNPQGTTMSCVTQNISLSGYSVGLGGSPITSGNVKVSAIGTDYTNSTTFNTETWSIDFHPCLVSGNLYTLQILISDNTGNRGETFQIYAAK